jgi:hypothetical protein
MSMDGFAEEVIALEAVPRASGEIGVVLIDRSIYVADRNGKRLRVLHPHGFASKVTTCTWTGSVPPAVAGGSMFSERYSRGSWGSKVLTPPATADGTDPVQEHFWTLEAKPIHMLKPISHRK